MLSVSVHLVTLGILMLTVSKIVPIFLVETMLNVNPKAYM